MTFWKEADATARRALIAASLGWMLDAFDVMLYALVLSSVRADLNLSADIAGGLQSLTLLASAAGGLVFGILAVEIAVNTDHSKAHYLAAVFIAIGLVFVWRSFYGMRIAQKA